MKVSIVMCQATGAMTHSRWTKNYFSHVFFFFCEDKNTRTATPIVWRNDAALGETAPAKRCSWKTIGAPKKNTKETLLPLTKNRSDRLKIYLVYEMETSLASGKIFIVIFLDRYADNNFSANYIKQVSWRATITNLYGISARRVGLLIDTNEWCTLHNYVKFRLNNIYRCQQSLAIFFTYCHWRILEGGFGVKFPPPSKLKKLKN